MLRRCSVILLVSLVAIGLTAADPLQGVLDKSYDARGGLKNLNSVDSARFSGKYAVVGMMEAPITLEWKRPNKLRLSFNTPQGDAVQAFDGEIAWQILPGFEEAQLLEGDQAAGLRRQADLIEGPLVDWKAKGHALEYLGEGEREGVSVHKLKLTQSGGPEMTVFLDAGTFLPVHQSGSTTVQGMETDVETYISDYKKVGQILIPHSLKSELIDVGLTQTITMESIELNVDLSDDMFRMPEGEAEAAEPAAVQ